MTIREGKGGAVGGAVGGAAGNIVILLSHSCYTAVALLFHCCYNLVTAENLPIYAQLEEARKGLWEAQQGILYTVVTPM
jgi:hypothetical protein